MTYYRHLDGVYDEEHGQPSLQLGRERRMSKVTMTKRFYVGSVKMLERPEWMGTLAETTEKARQMTAGDGLERYVVEVVRIVRPAKTPVVVDEVRK